MSSTNAPTFAPGPWTNEPDRELWKDEASGLDCLIRRGPSGALCGYVGVPAGHLAHGADIYDWESDLLDGINVHGGLTYAAPCDGDQEAGICHVPQPGEPDDVYWLGFDCSHAFDLRPSSVGKGYPFSPGPDETYRDFEYVRSEVTSLAAQLAALAVGL